MYNIANGEAEFGRIVIDGARVNKKGLGTLAAEAICKIGFEQFELSRIILEVFSDNKRAIRTYEKAGFDTVGTKFFDGIEITLMEIIKEKK